MPCFPLDDALHSVRVASHSDHTVITPEGTLTMDRVCSIIERCYPQIASRGIVWDLSECDTIGVTRRCHPTIATVTATVRHRKEPNKTAFVAPSAQKFADMCNYLNAVLLIGASAEYCVFKTLAQAQAWLQ